MCSLFYSARALFLLLLSALSRDFSVFLCVFTIFLCVFTISVRSWLSALSPRWYMYFPKMIHVFLQDDITIACTISVESCLPWAVIELAVRPTCSQNLEDVEVTLQFFSLHVCIYSFMQQCKYAQPCTMSCYIFHFISTRCNKSLTTRHALCCQICFHVMKIGKIK